MTWRVELEDITVESSDLTVGEAIAFQDMRSKEIHAADPAAVFSDAMALLIARVMSRDSTGVEAARKVIDPKPLDALKIVDLGSDEDPKDSSLPATPDT